MSQHLLDLIHGDLETKGAISYTRAQQIATECKVKFETVRDEIRGAIRERAKGWGGEGKDWELIRIRAKLEAAQKLAMEREGVVTTAAGEVKTYPNPDIASLVRAIVAEAQVCGLMAQKAPKKGEDAPHDNRPDAEVWREALRDCPKDLLIEALNAMKGMH